MILCLYYRHSNEKFLIVMPKSNAQRMRNKRERDYALLLDSTRSERQISDTGLIEVIGVCYRKAKDNGNTGVLKIALKELNRRIQLIDDKKDNCRS
ncbi:hypothetical protein [Cysteiniphilum marinum]|uniref:hypothetical protein n=1 Tax=Cysteiniphilum marinum TaxID=2774191 RepID=UPI00193B19CA|nr:hypothetical protein [Cysteiniphilum marinum]